MAVVYMLSIVTFLIFIIYIDITLLQFHVKGYFKDHTMCHIVEDI